MVEARDASGGTIRGRCMCGDIRYEITGPLSDVVHCHCESCRRHCSAPFITAFNVDKAHFRYTQGTPVPYTSSAGVERALRALRVADVL